MVDGNPRVPKRDESASLVVCLEGGTLGTCSPVQRQLFHDLADLLTRAANFHQLAPNFCGAHDGDGTKGEELNQEQRTGRHNSKVS